MTLSAPAILARAAQLCATFEAAGALRVETDVLQPADRLLDLYGEDIRGRAYVTRDPSDAEMMLRPDFTVPVVLQHMQGGAEPARYAYSGKVFRRQESDPDRPREYVQVGYEVFDRSNPAETDAEVFAVLSDAVAGAGLRPVTGDLGILMAAIDGLATTERRKAALRRHIWRPARFRALLDRFGGRADVPAARAALVAGDISPPEAPLIGLRAQDEVDERIAALRADAAEPPLTRPEMELFDLLLSVTGALPDALGALQALVARMPTLASAVGRLADRSDALAARGCDVSGLEFQATFGRTTMEYYDGFVFGLFAPGADGSPPVVSGGRYDALTAQLGQGQSIPAVGGIIRPDLLVAAEVAT